MGIDRLKQIEITDEDVTWVESIMGFRFDGNRSDIIKNLESIDIQAFPGSGKTTILIAKLAILAKKWSYTNAGICVLSHTNVAREEIEERLGNTDIGKKLLMYPHFIGTLHSFFDTFVALPWLRSNGISMNLIDSNIVKEQRWSKVPYKAKLYLEHLHVNEQICSHSGEIGQINLPSTNKYYQTILDIIQESQQNGNFTFDEMLLYSKQALEECDSLSIGLQQRFPIVFIDEAQDTNSFQWELLHKAFPELDGITIQQGFGDRNQAIYNYVNEVVDKPEFPRIAPLILNESQRFDNRIARLANTVAVSSEQMIGTQNEFTERESCHTIYLFSKDKAPQVIEEFGQLVLNTFSDAELLKNRKAGCHVVGMVHVKKDDTSEKQFPKGIYDYWPCYEANKMSKNTNPNRLIEYIRMGRYEFEKNGELCGFIDWSARGIRRLINITKGQNFIIANNNPFSAIAKQLPEEKQLAIRKDFFRLFAADISTEENWGNIQCIIEDILDQFDLKINSKAKSFVLWTAATDLKYDDQEKTLKVLPNHYIYREKNSERCVDLEFGSIHSVKGRTHLATLVLETFSKAHNMKKILKYLCDKPPKSIGANQSRLKCQYVAMTRAKALLCLAIPIEFVDDKAQELLEAVGWTIKIIS
ncbi:UvrD-helicase domain-containing protein [Enterocloster sp. 210928-DFI.2.20]|jgi:hypothetical protein|uniref:UvrD-helicase domain-containing protein n=1 Tax=Enterocloster TaxID=2719313 RepID=UPI0018A0885F|nr:MULTISPECIES: UvrD-helicase domain-containing protein [Enterocloster]MCB7097806.1 UvrD-helicase domain-containing protein [Enterocloster sp. 210928-DFI.2.20]MCB7357192.1 UvrD-helicase domain-containing protein [Enterocloster bolteae]